jgi:hypothetical protein
LATDTRNFSVVIEEEWAAGCRHIRAAEEENISRKQGTDNVIDKITTKPNDDDIESSGITDKEDVDGVVSLSNDRKWSLNMHTEGPKKR